MLSGCERNMIHNSTVYHFYSQPLVSLWRKQLLSLFLAVPFFCLIITKKKVFLVWFQCDAAACGGQKTRKGKKVKRQTEK